MIVATTPFIAGHRVVETKGQTFGLVVRSRGFSRQPDRRAALARRRRDPRVHARSSRTPDARPSTGS